MVNEFLLPNIINGGVHHQSCFCDCREMKLNEYLRDDTRTTRELEHSFLSDSGEYMLLNRLFEETKAKIIRGEGFFQHCLRNTPYVSFGAWMNTQERYDSMSVAEKRRFCRKINIVHDVFKEWGKIVENLTDNDIWYIDARKLSIHQLHQAISPEWCAAHDESLRDPCDIPDELEYDEEKYRSVLRYIHTIGLLGDVNYDRRKTAIIGRRLQRDLGKMSKIGREDNE